MASGKHTPKRLSILLDTAIASAYQDGFPHHAALASERAGIFFFRSAEEKLASKYLTRASLLYEEWGAITKVDQIESHYGKFLKKDASLQFLKKNNNTQSGTLMFTEKKVDPGIQHAGGKAARRSSLQHGEQAPMRAMRRSSLQHVPPMLPAQRRSSLQHVRPVQPSTPDDSPRSLSPGIYKKNPSKPGAQHVQSSQSRGRPILSKASKEKKGPRSKSLTYDARPSLIRIGSWGSIDSNISRMSDDRSSSGDKSANSKARKKKKSSVHSRRSDSASKSSRQNKSKHMKQNGSGEREKKDKDTKKAAESKISENETAEKVIKVKNGPIPSPNPRRGKLQMKEEDFEKRSYLLDYDTDDFDTVGSSLGALGWAPKSPQEYPQPPRAVG